MESLSRSHLKSYGLFSGKPSEEQLARYFNLDDTDLTLIYQRRGACNRLGFAVQLGTVRFLSTFLKNPVDVPEKVIGHVAAQLSINDISPFYHYGIGETHWDHVTVIKECYGYKNFTDIGEYFRIVRWLYNRCCLGNERQSLLFDLATAQLVDRKVLLPGATILARLIVRVRDRTAKNLWSSLNAMTSLLQRRCLEGLLEIAEGDRQSHLDRLRNGPVRISGPALVTALKRVEEFRSLGVSGIDLSSFSPGRIESLARYAAHSKAAHIAQMRNNRRTATLLAFAKHFELKAMDDALDVLDLLAYKIFTKARATGKKNRMRTLRDLDRAALDLREACAVIMDDTLPAEHLRKLVFNKIPRARLKEATSLVGELARHDDDNYEEEITESYRAVRRFLPTVLRTIRFSSINAGRPVLNALNFLLSIEGKNNPDMSQAPLHGFSKAWLRRIIGEDKKIDKKSYTLCSLECLQIALRRRDVFVCASTKWSDPREKLLPLPRWKLLKHRFCQSLGHPKSGAEAAKILSSQLDGAYREVLPRLASNAALLLHPANESKHFTLSSLDRLEEPETLIQLRKEVAVRLPRVDLPEVLLEINSLTGFANEFTHVSEENARAKGFVISLCASLVSQACNTGLEPVVDSSFPPLMRHKLSWVMQNYFRAETLVRANACLVDRQAVIPLAKLWGGGEVASADGMRFVVPVQTIHAGANKKYFGRERGVTWYNFLSNQCAGLHQIVIPGTLRDSIYILEGLLEHETSLKITEIMADTVGSSNIVFGLFWLLGYQFSPRLADIGKARFWRCDPQADYGELNSLSRNRIKPEHYIQHWDDILRTAASLKMGTISASELIHSLFNSKRPTALGKAIAELGKIPKTMHMLNFINDEAYRRRILNQLNKGEGRHGLGREVYHGHGGKLRQRYREGQENQLGALGLVLNALVLWNTIYMQKTLDQLRTEGYKVLPEDAARLSPLGYEHFNFRGRYSFRLEGPPAEGKLRPLRNPHVHSLLAT